MIEVELPDGTIAEFPDDTSHEVIKGALKKHFAEQNAQTPKSADAPGLREKVGGFFGSVMDTVDAAARGSKDMLTFGFNDEINAGLGTGFGFLGDYDKALERERSIDQYDQENHPVARTAGQILGGVTGGLGSANAGLSVAGSAIKAGRGAIPTLAGSMADSAIGGATYGFGSGEGGFDNRAENAGMAGLGGAAVGLVMPVAGAAVSKAVAGPVKAFKSAVSGRLSPKTYATEKVAERLGGEVGLAQAQSRLAQNPGSMLVDVTGKSGRDLLRATTNIPGKAKDRAQALLTVRQFGQGDRLKSAISKTFANPDGYLAAKDQIAAEAKRIATPLYERAYARPMHFSKPLEEILETPAGRAALRHAENLADNEQIPFQQLFVNVKPHGSATVKRVPDTRAWDYIKRAMDDMIDAQTDTITKQVTNEGRILIGLKNRMLKQLDFLNPDYAAARKAFAGQAQLDDAMEAGRKVFTMSPEAMKRTIAEMTPAEKAMARIGAAETLRGQIDAAGLTQNAVLRIFSKPGQIKNLQTLFESAEKFAEFRKAIFAEARKRATYEAVKGNSTTAAQLAELQDAGAVKEGIEFLGNVASGRPLNATWNWISGRLNRLGGMTPEAADHIARILMTNDTASAETIVNEMIKIEQSKIGADEKRRMIQALIAPATMRPETPSIGRAIAGR